MPGTQDRQGRALQRDLGRAQSKYAESEKHLGRFETKLERASESEPPALVAEAEIVAELPRALDAA